MPNRIIREGILTSEKINALSSEGELFYRRLMSVVDDFGRIESHPKTLLAKCYPLQIDRVTVADVKTRLRECCSSQEEGDPLITSYSVNGKQYLQMNNFGQRKRASKFPGPEQSDSPKSVRQSVDDRHMSDTRHDVAACDDLTHSLPTTPSTTTTPPNVFSGKEVQEENLTAAALVASQDFEGFEQFEEICGMLIGLGRGMSASDRIDSENCWKAYTVQKRIRAYRCAVESFEDWQTRPREKIPMPVNYFRFDQWERHTPRVIPQTAPKSRTQTNHEKAAAEFMAEQARGGR